MTQEINIIPYIQRAQDARGTAVVIDTYRGSSLINALFGLGAQEIHPIWHVDEAREIKQSLMRQHNNVLLIGEMDGITPKDFDFGNGLDALVTNPNNASRINGAQIVYVSTNAVKGILEASRSKANEILVGSPLNRGALLHYLADKKEVTLLPVGERDCGEQRYAEEDMLYANYVKDILEGKKPNYEEVRCAILRGKSAQLATQYDAEFDRDYCLNIDFYDTLPALRDGKLINIRNGNKNGKR